MDFNKFAQIALKDIRSMFTDRAALMITIVTPFILTLVLAAAFSGISMGGSDSPLKDIPVLVVNQDKGTTLVVMPMNFGRQLTDTLGTIQMNPPDKLLGVTVMDSEEAAKAQVRAGKASAAVLIPAGFSDSLNPTLPQFGDTKIQVTVFRDAGSPLGGDIVSSIAKQMVNGYASAMIAIRAGSQVNPTTIVHAEDIAQSIAQQMNAASTQPSSSSGTQTGTQRGPQINLLQFFAPAMAIFFLNFSMVFGVVSIIEERDNWTLQRLLISPTSRITILAGKLGGTYVSGILQITILIIATSPIGPVMGNTVPVWGTNILALILTVVIVVAGAMGIGTLLASLARTRQQAVILANAILIVMGIVGGTFFVSSGGPPMGVLSQLTVNYWANNAFSTLAATGDLSAILPNLAALLAIFVVGFVGGLYLFNRRLAV